MLIQISTLLRNCVNTSKVRVFQLFLPPFLRHLEYWSKARMSLNSPTSWIQNFSHAGVYEPNLSWDEYFGSYIIQQEYTNCIKKSNPTQYNKWNEI